MMFALVALSILALGVIIDRLRVFKLAEVDSDSLRNRLVDALDDKDADRAVEACKDTTGPAAAVLLVGLKQYRAMLDRGKSENLEGIISRSMNDYAPHVIDSLEKRLNLLAMVGTVAPLIGMTGTVVGMITSFNDMAAGGLEAGSVGSGISLALVTTAAGLIVAIPAVISHNIFTRRIEMITLQVEETANALINYVTLNH
ncbi:MAG: biopolymer transport protein ExbB [Rhodothermales bacterium]|jgi:biopolymer transport protein ExbB